MPPKRPPPSVVLDGVGVEVGISLVNVVDSPTKMMGVEETVVFGGGAYPGLLSFEGLPGGAGGGTCSGT